MIDIHPTARVSPLADIEDSIRGTRIVIAMNALLDSFVKVKPAGGCGDLYIGARSQINSCCVLYTGNGIWIGDDCAVASNCTFAPTNHEYKRADLTINTQGFRASKGGITLEGDVWVGANCVLLDGTILRRGCVIGAGSVVRGDIPAYSIQAGNPLRLIGWRK